MNKKIVLLLALVATLILVLVACGTDSEPVDTTVATEAATGATTEAPAETTEAPAETTEAPVETTEAPVETTEAPAETTEAPVEETTAEPETETPEVVEPYTVDLSTVTATGNWPTVDVPVPGSVFGMDHCFALHYGSINLGEIDLSRYSKVTVTYATPDDATVPGASDQYNMTGKRVLLLNAPSAAEGTFECLPEESAIITSTQYERSPASLTTTTVEIDLTNVTYNGTVYLTFDYRDANNGQAANGFLVWVTGISFA